MKITKADMRDYARRALPNLAAAIAAAVPVLRTLDEVCADLEPGDQCELARVMFQHASNSLKKSGNPVARAAIVMFLGDLYEPKEAGVES